MTNPFPGLDYLFMCVIHDNKCDYPIAAEIIKLAVDSKVQAWQEMIKVKTQNGGDTE